ncbi:hypothetical protein, partial [Sutterella wadsworthensis]|uniref:hypothetical protein n=1 Tax=Sutterella wadsworthensis TaxID=40545 RepID=UPI00243212F2
PVLNKRRVEVDRVSPVSLPQCFHFSSKQTQRACYSGSSEENHALFDPLRDSQIYILAIEVTGLNPD